MRIESASCARTTQLLHLHPTIRAIRWTSRSRFTGTRFWRLSHACIRMLLDAHVRQNYSYLFRDSISEHLERLACFRDRTWATCFRLRKLTSLRSGLRRSRAGPTDGDWKESSLLTFKPDSRSNLRFATCRTAAPMRIRILNLLMPAVRAFAT